MSHLPGLRFTTAIGQLYGVEWPDPFVTEWEIISASSTRDSGGWRETTTATADWPRGTFRKEALVCLWQHPKYFDS